MKEGLGATICVNSEIILCLYVKPGGSLLVLPISLVYNTVPLQYLIQIMSPL